MINSDEVEKIIVAPQIVIYKNFLQYCDELIKVVESKSKDNSLWPQWEPWYEQGLNINQLFNRDQFQEKSDDSEDMALEKKILRHIMEVYDFIQKDYLSEYAGDKGVWPQYIKQWDKVWEKLDPVHINIYKYSNEHFESINREGLMLEYHVDEMPEEARDERPSHQVVTITFYPNDDYDGGEICFYDESENKAYKYKPRKGDVTVFPSAAPFYHAVEHFSGADRYFMRIFIPYFSFGDKEWEKNNITQDKDFMEKQQKKVDDFVANYTHAVTLQFPGEKVDIVRGKLVQLDEAIKIID
jgi:hypothetical protein